MKKIMITLMLAAVTLTGTGLFAQGREWRDGPPPPPEEGDSFFHRCFGDRGFLRNNLQLSDEQIEKVAGINENFRKRHDELRERMRPRRIELKALLLAEKIDFDSVRKKLREISEIEVELKIIQIQHRLSLQEILTPEQKKQLIRERREMKHRHGMRPRDE
jgi:Spy/CpxP family protein refolding chaperone